MYHIYKHLIQKEICSTLENKNYSKNIVLVAIDAVVIAADV